MALYLVSYDIKEEDRDEYQELWDYFDELGAKRLLFSEYATPYDGTAFELAQKVCQHLRPADRLLVCELFNSNNDALAWFNVRIGDDVFNKLLTGRARTLK
jgi:CRISPR-associated endonuclease Cas2